MSEKLQSVWPVLALDGVGDAIGDARPIFVVSTDGRLLRFANAGGARFLGLPPIQALDARVTLEPRLADRLRRFAATAHDGDATRELVRFFDGLRSTLLSVGFRRLDADAVLVAVDNARTDAGDADPAASLAAIAAEGGLVALFDGDDEVTAALGDHGALDGVQEEIEAALDAEDGDAVFARTVETGGHVRDVTLVRLGSAARPRRLLRVGPPRPGEVRATAAPIAAEPVIAPPVTAPPTTVAPAEPSLVEPEDLAFLIGETPALETVAANFAAPDAPPADIASEPEITAIPDETPSARDGAAIAAAVAAVTKFVETPALGSVEERPAMPVPEVPRPEVPPTDHDHEAASEALAHAVATVTATIPTVEDEDGEDTDAAREPLGGEAPEAADVAAPAEPEIAPAAMPATAGPVTRRRDGRTVKFVWQMDVERRFTLVSDELIEAVGPRAADIIGRSWREVADDFGLDPEGRVAAALERRDTWSGRTVAWPVEGEALRLPVDLAALPAFDRGRVFVGFRGFGTVRGGEPIPDPTGVGLRLAASRTDDPATVAATEATPVGAPLVSSLLPVPTATTLEPPPARADDGEDERDPAPAVSATDRDDVALDGESESLEALADEIETGETPVIDIPSFQPAWNDDAPSATEPVEIELGETRHVLPAMAIAPSDAAAFDGEIAIVETPRGGTTSDEPPSPGPDAAATVEAEKTDTLPSIWLDDELAVAMASLPPFAGERETEAANDADTATGKDAAPGETAETATDEASLPEAPPLPPVSPLALLAEELDHPDEALQAAWIADVRRPATEAVEPEAIETAADEVAHVGTRPAHAPEASHATLAAIGGAIEAASEATAGEASLDARTSPGEIPTGETVLPAAGDEASTEASDLAAFRHEIAEDGADGDTPPQTTETPDALTDVESGTRLTALSAAPATETTIASPARPHAPPEPAESTPIDAARLSVPERAAFRQIAAALGARIEDDIAPRAKSGDDASTGTTALADPALRPAWPASVETRLLDRLPGPIAVVKDDSFVYGNGAFLRLLGYPDLATLEAEGGLDALFAGEHVARRWNSGPDGSRPVPVLTRDGRVIPVDATVATVPWKGASALMLTLTEVEPPTSETTPAPVPAKEPAPIAALPPPPPAPAEVSPPPEPAQAEAANDGNERVAELEAIIDTATDGVLMLDGDGIILSANHAAEALFGTDRKEMIGRPLTDRLAPESRRSAVDYLDGLARNGVASVLNDGREVIGVVERGGLIPLFMTIGRISARPARKYCAVLRDITQWKKSEEELTAARRRAEEASVHKSDFLAKISHEIRTPLNAIIGFSEVMIDERFGPIGNERYKDYLRDIHSSGSHIMSLINDLLDLSKVEAGKMDLRFEAVTLGDIMSECVAMMQPQANRERIIIRSSLPTGVPPVVADPRSVRQVVLNLLSNAIKFTPAGGQVIVSTTLEDSGEVVMRVRDTGYGMTEKELQAAMEPFRQLHTTRSRGGGTGLGLPLTKALVEANRAVFRIDSSVGQGTLVTVTFPVTRVLAS